MDMEIFFPGVGKRVDVKYRGFLIKTDQPVFAGGNGEAPAPFDYFLASIGACAGIYILSFCEQRGLDYKNIKLVQKHEFDPKKRMISKITIEIQLPEGFPEKYKKALIHAANLCAVKQHMYDPPEFDIKTVDVK